MFLSSKDNHFWLPCNVMFILVVDSVCRAQVVNYCNGVWLILFSTQYSFWKRENGKNSLGFKLSR